MEAATKQQKDATSAEEAQRAASPPSSGEAPVYFDFERHERVQQHHKAGIRTDLGVRYGFLEVRLRPFHVHAVVVRRDTVEQAVRIKLGLAEDDPIPPAEGIAINRAAVVMAITGAKGKVLLPTARRVDDAGDELPSLADVAKDVGIAIENVDGKPVAVLDYSIEAPAVRALFAALLEVSMPLLTTLVKASRQLQKVADEEIDRLGEDYVYGAPAQDGWHD